MSFAKEFNFRVSCLLVDYIALLHPPLFWWLAKLKRLWIHLKLWEKMLSSGSCQDHSTSSDQINNRGLWLWMESKTWTVQRISNWCLHLREMETSLLAPSYPCKWVKNWSKRVLCQVGGLCCCRDSGHVLYGIAMLRWIQWKNVCQLCLFIIKVSFGIHNILVQLLHGELSQEGPEGELKVWNVHTLTFDFVLDAFIEPSWSLFSIPTTPKIPCLLFLSLPHRFSPSIFSTS